MLSSMIAIDVYAKKQARLSPMSPDELVSYYRDLRSGHHPILTESSSDSALSHKCGLWVTAQLLDQWKNLTAQQRQEIQALIRQTSLQKDTIIEHFHIFYDTSGLNTPALFDGTGAQIGDALAYVDSVGAIFNHVWDVEIRILGFSQPPFEIGQSHYNIYISNLGNGNYGGTNPVDLISGTQPERYSSNIDINNDFIGSSFFTKGIQALRVTAAHEFHHAIQFGYGWWGSDERYAYELTSTWMEDVVYTDVNDYYQYLPDYFVGFHVGLSFNSDNYGGYERCIWAHYLAKRFSPSIMRDVWTRMSTQPFLESTDAALVNIGSNLPTAFSEFTYWNYYTADRADTVKYYPKGNHYPRFQPLQKIVYNNGDVTVGGDVSPLSSSMYEFDLSSPDTLTAMIANVDVNGAEIGQTLTRRVDITLFSQNYPPPFHQFENGLKARIAVADTSRWHDFFSQSSTVEYVIKRLSNLAPNPFHINTDQQLFLPVNEDEIGLAQVFFYSSSLSLVYTAEVNITYQNKSMVIAVSGTGLTSKLSSGVFFIVAKTKKKDYQWKVSVIR